MLTETMKALANGAPNVRQRFQRFNAFLTCYPGLKQPWAGTSERLRRFAFRTQTERVPTHVQSSNSCPEFQLMSRVPTHVQSSNSCPFVAFRGICGSIPRNATNGHELELWT